MLSSSCASAAAPRPDADPHPDTTKGPDATSGPFVVRPHHRSRAAELAAQLPEGIQSLESIALVQYEVGMMRDSGTSAEAA